MTTEMELVVDTCGIARRIDDEARDLRTLGNLQITLASRVEPDAEGHWFPTRGLLMGQRCGRSGAGRRRWGRRGGG